MDLAVLVQNIKLRCKAKGVPPTVACKEADVGTNFITDINKGSVPSVAKVQKMATYLGCTVSDLLGEKKDDLAIAFYNVPPQDTIEEVFEIATQMVPVTISHLERHANDLPSLSRTGGPYSLTINAQLQRVANAPLGEEKEPDAKGAGLTAAEQSLIDLFRLLSEEQQNMVIHVVQAASDKQKPSR